MAYNQIVADSSVPKITFNSPILSIKGKRLFEGNDSASAEITVAGTLAGSNGETFVFNSLYDSVIYGTGVQPTTLTTDSSKTIAQSTSTLVGTSDISSLEDSAEAIFNSLTLIATPNQTGWDNVTRSNNVITLAVSSVQGSSGNIASSPSGGLVTGGEITMTDFTGGESQTRKRNYSFIVNENIYIGAYTLSVFRKVHKSFYDKAKGLITGGGSFDEDYVNVGGAVTGTSTNLRNSYINFVNLSNPTAPGTGTLTTTDSNGWTLTPINVMDDTTDTELKAWYKAEQYQGNLNTEDKFTTSVNIKDFSATGNDLTPVNSPTTILIPDSSDMEFSFNGTSQYFEKASPSGFNIGTNGYAMFVVFTTPSSFTDDAYRTIFDKSSFQVNWYLRYKVDDDATPNGSFDLKQGGFLDQNVQKTIALATNTTYMLTVHRDGSNGLCSIYVNGDGKVSATNNKNLNLATGNVDLGVTKVEDRHGNVTRQDYFNGTIKEFLFYDLGSSNDIADNPRERVEGYLAHKWGLAGNLPSDHAFKDGPPLMTSTPVSVLYTGDAAP